MNNAVYGYAGIIATPLPHSKDHLLVKVAKETMDLKRFLKMPFYSQYIYDIPANNLTKLNDVPQDSAASSVVF